MKTNSFERVLQFICEVVLLGLFNAFIPLEVITYILIITIIVYGIAHIVLIFKSGEKDRFWHLIAGVLITFIGVIALYNFIVVEVAVGIYAYLFLGFGFMFLAASSLANHVTNFDKDRKVLGVIKIIIDIVLLGLTVTIFFMPRTELLVILIFVSLSMMVFGITEIADACTPDYLI